MAELDHETAFTQLLNILRKHGFAWVVTQIQDEIRAGKPVTRKVPILPASFERYRMADLGEPPRRPGKPGAFAATEEYTPTEKLTLAVDAFVHSVLDVSDLENHVFDHFHKAIDREPVIRFLPDEGEDTPEFQILRKRPGRSRSLAELRELIEKLRAEI